MIEPYPNGIYSIKKVFALLLTVSWRHLTMYFRVHNFSFSLVIVSLIASVLLGDSGNIRIYEKNPQYWQYKGKPVVLIGGSVEDNLFQIPNLKEHLDLLKSVGGNYVRNTMSARDDGNVWQFAKLDNGKYDLDRWNDEYWKRFENFLELTEERDIIVQIELWATFDYYRDIWDRNPFNPKNNINYTANQTGLPTVVKTHPTRTENNFFWSVPKERNQQTVLKYQQKFIDKILSYTLDFPNILYCMDNETSVTPEWGWYWSGYITKRAKDEGVSIETTEMWDNWNLAAKQHNPTFDHPKIYSFVDISQNNHQKGQAHWNNAQKQRKRIAKKLRPLNNVKIYGADTGRFGNTQDGLERFWRNIFGGLASARFHRPDSGNGLGKTAQAHLKSMSMLLDRFDIFNSVADSDCKMLKNREDNEAYMMYVPGKQCAVYFPKGGSVEIVLPKLNKGKYNIQTLDIASGRWSEKSRTFDETTLSFTQGAPKGKHSVVLITPAR